MKERNHKTKGFTLIELLAVIVILAVIALISVPMVLNIIEKARKTAFKDSAYGIMESAKLYYAEHMIDNQKLEDKVFSYEGEETELKYSGTKPKGGIVIVKKDGKVEMSIHNGKWCAIKEGENIKIIDYNEATCTINSPIIVEGESTEDIELGFNSVIPGNYYNIKNQKGTITCLNLSDGNKEVTNTSELKEGENCIECNMMYKNQVITSLKRTFKIKKTGVAIEEIMKDNPEVAALDPDKNLRFVGENPKNYVEFGNDIYRIIGVFNKQMKIIYWGSKTNVGEFYQNAELSFDPKASDGGHGSTGYNDWAQAKLQTTLNTEYWDTIPTKYQEMVDQSHVWNIGGKTGYGIRSEIYTDERGSKKSSIMSSHLWTGKIGLMYPSDYGYATNGANCDTDMYQWYRSYSNNAQCYSISNNWLASMSYNQWTMTPYSSGEDDVYFVSLTGRLLRSYAYMTTVRTRPVLYLQSNVKITNGDGTENSPYELKLETKVPSLDIAGSDIVKDDPEVAALDPYHNPRYIGGNPKNYVEFGNDIYRIIGVFNKQMKIIYWGSKTNVGEFYQNAELSFDPKASDGGHGYNDWAQAKLQATLNTEYWDTIPTKYQEMVDQSHVWNIGGKTGYGIRSEIYTDERGSKKSSIMSSHLWTGKIGLMYPSDYGYATNGANCDTDMYQWYRNYSNNAQCYSISNNWLASMSYNQWTMTPYSSGEDDVYFVDMTGRLLRSYAYMTTVRTRPVLYLQSNVKITNAEVANAGTIDNPYTLSL